MREEYIFLILFILLLSSMVFFELGRLQGINDVLNAVVKHKCNHNYYMTCKWVYNITFEDFCNDMIKECCDRYSICGYEER